MLLLLAPKRLRIRMPNQSEIVKLLLYRRALSRYGSEGQEWWSIWECETTVDVSAKDCKLMDFFPSL